MERPFSSYRGEDPYIFVSYSHEDAEIVYPGISWLRDQGFNIWYDEGISPGASWREELARAIMNCDLFVILVSPNSAKSSNCLKELNFALEHDREVLAIHQEPTTLPPGLQLALSDRQAIFRHELTEEKYRAKILDGIRNHVQPGETAGDVVPVPAEPKMGRHVKRGMLATALVLVLVAAGSGWYLTTQTGGSQARVVDEEQASVEAPPEVRNNWLAVLPFTSLSAGADADALATGITTQLIPALAPIPRINMVPYRTMAPFRERSIGLEEVARELNLRYLIDGRLQQAGARTRVTVELIDGIRGMSLWQETRTFENQDALAIQDAVTAMTVRAVSNRLDAAEIERIRALPRAQLTTSELTSLATSYWFDPNQENLETAIADLRQALAINPDDVDALATLAQLLTQNVLTGRQSRESARQEACQLADRAVELGAIEEGAVNVVYAIVDLCDDPERAAQLAGRAVATYPENAATLATYAYALIAGGHVDEGLAALNEAEALDPSGLWIRYLVDPLRALAYMSQGDWPRGVEIATRAVNENPANYWIEMCLANGLGLTGDYEGAREHWQRVKARFPDVGIANGAGSLFLMRSSSEWVEGLRLANVEGE